MNLLKPGQVGVGITTQNRAAVCDKVIQMVYEMTPGAHIAIVDDASDIPYPPATFRFPINVGIAAAKNKCLELLEAAGCEHFFLFDDDVWPIQLGWEQKYIEAAKQHEQHYLTFTFSYLSDGRPNGNKPAWDFEGDLVSYGNPCGLVQYLDRCGLVMIGGFDERFGKYGSEHAALAWRFLNAGLTTRPFLDIKGSLSLFHSQDYWLQTTSSVPNRKTWIAKNLPKLAAVRDSANYIPFRGQRNFLFAAYFNGEIEVQDLTKPNRKRYTANVAEVFALQQSAEALGLRLILFHDCFPAAVVKANQTPFWTFVQVPPCRRQAPSSYRFKVYLDFLDQNPWIDRVFCVDCNDVQVLKDPFRAMKRGTIYLGDEAGIKWGNDWVRKHFSKVVEYIPGYTDLMEANAEKTLLNCGLLGSDRETLLRWLQAMAALDPTDGNVHTRDMGVTNFIARSGGYKISHGVHVNTGFKKHEMNQVSWFKHK